MEGVGVGLVRNREGGAGRGWAPVGAKGGLGLGLGLGLELGLGLVRPGRGAKRACMLGQGRGEAGLHAGAHAEEHEKHRAPSNQSPAAWG